MRRLILLVCFIALNGCAGLKVATKEQLILEQVIKVNNVDAITAYNKTIEWLATNFEDSKEVIEVRDIQNKQILGKVIVIYSGPIVPYRYGASVKYQFKDNRFRVTYSNMTFRNPGPRFGGSLNVSEIEAAKTEFSKLSNSLQEFMLSEDKSNW